jgi:hypothetical protein
VFTIIGEMDFSKKLTILKKIGVIEDETHNTLFKVNDYRVIFSHPSSKAKELDGLKNPEKYLEVLKALVKAKEQINKEKDIR